MSELQAIMARRRRLADGMEEEKKSTATAHANSTSAMDAQQPAKPPPRRTGSVRNKMRLFDSPSPRKTTKSDLQAIMERRRKLEASLEIPPATAATPVVVVNEPTSEPMATKDTEATVETPQKSEESATDFVSQLQKREEEQKPGKPQKVAPETSFRNETSPTNEKVSNEETNGESGSSIRQLQKTFQKEGFRSPQKMQHNNMSPPPSTKTRKSSRVVQSWAERSQRERETVKHSSHKPAFGQGNLRPTDSPRKEAAGDASESSTTTNEPRRSVVSPSHQLNVPEIPMDSPTAEERPVGSRFRPSVEATEIKSIRSPKLFQSWEDRSQRQKREATATTMNVKSAFGKGYLRPTSSSREETANNLSDSSIVADPSNQQNDEPDMSTNSPTEESSVGNRFRLSVGSVSTTNAASPAPTNNKISQNWDDRSSSLQQQQSDAVDRTPELSNGSVRPEDSSKQQTVVLVNDPEESSTATKEPPRSTVSQSDEQEDANIPADSPTEERSRFRSFAEATPTEIKSPRTPATKSNKLLQRWEDRSRQRETAARNEPAVGRFRSAGTQQQSEETAGSVDGPLVSSADDSMSNPSRLNESKEPDDSPAEEPVKKPSDRNTPISPPIDVQSKMQSESSGSSFKQLQAAFRQKEQDASKLKNGEPMRRPAPLVRKSRGWLEKDDPIDDVKHQSPDKQGVEQDSSTNPSTSRATPTTEAQCEMSDGEDHSEEQVPDVPMEQSSIDVPPVLTYLDPPIEYPSDDTEESEILDPSYAKDECHTNDEALPDVDPTDQSQDNKVYPFFQSDRLESSSLERIPALERNDEGGDGLQQAASDVVPEQAAVVASKEVKNTAWNQESQVDPSENAQVDSAFGKSRHLFDDSARVVDAPELHQTYVRKKQREELKQASNIMGGFTQEGTHPSFETNFKSDGFFSDSHSEHKQGGMEELAGDSWFGSAENQEERLRSQDAMFTAFGDFTPESASTARELVDFPLGIAALNHEINSESMDDEYKTVRGAQIEEPSSPLFDPVLQDESDTSSWRTTSTDPLAVRKGDSAGELSLRNLPTSSITTTDSLSQASKEIPVGNQFNLPYQLIGPMNGEAKTTTIEINETLPASSSFVDEENTPSTNTIKNPIYESDHEKSPNCSTTLGISTDLQDARFFRGTTPRKKNSPRRRKSSRRVDIVDTDLAPQFSRAEPDSGGDEKLPESAPRRSPSDQGSNKVLDESPLDFLSSSDEHGFFSSDSDDHGLRKKRERVSRKKNTRNSEGPADVDQTGGSTSSVASNGASADVVGTLTENLPTVAAADPTLSDRHSPAPTNEATMEEDPPTEAMQLAETTSFDTNYVAEKFERMMDLENKSVDGGSVVGGFDGDISGRSSPQPLFDSNMMLCDELSNDPETLSGGTSAHDFVRSMEESMCEQTSVSGIDTRKKDDENFQASSFSNDKEAQSPFVDVECRKPLHESHAPFGNFSNMDFPAFENPIGRDEDIAETEDMTRSSAEPLDDTFPPVGDFLCAVPAQDSALEFTLFGDDFDEFDDANFPVVNKSAEGFALTDVKAAAVDRDFAVPEFSPNDSPNDWDTSPIDHPQLIAQQRSTLAFDVVVTTEFLVSPIINPSNSNTIFATTLERKAVLREVDARRDGVSIVTQPLITPELCHLVKKSLKATVCAVKSVLSLSAGQCGCSTQLVVMADLVALEMSSPLRVLLVYDWTETVKESSLVSILSPPDGVDSVYDSATLIVTDGAVFLAGRSSRGACVFVHNFISDASWSTNYLEGDGDVSALSTIRVQTALPLLVVALSDLSVSVWRYSVGEATSRCLFPFCRLEYLSMIPSAVTLRFLPDDVQNTDDEQGSHGAADLGQTHFMSFLPTLTTSSPLLAIVFERGLAVFTLPLPTRESTKNRLDCPVYSDLQSAPVVSPVALNHWSNKHERSHLSWVDLGPYSNPTLFLVLSASNRTLVLVGDIEVPSSYSPELIQKGLLDFHSLSIRAFDPEAASTPVGVLSHMEDGSVVCFGDNALLRVRIDNCLVTQPITSTPFGLSGGGDDLLTDTKECSDGVLYIACVVQFESAIVDELVQAIYPVVQFWLCKVNVEEESLQLPTRFGEADDNYNATFGARSDLLCELTHQTLKGLRPRRLIRCRECPVCAVMFGPTSVDLKRPAIANKVAFVDYRSESRIHVVDGRDVAFIPSGSDDRVNGLLLSSAGSSLSFFTLTDSGFQLFHDTSCRPLLGIDPVDGYVDCREIYSFTSESTVSIGVVGCRLEDERFCFATGSLHQTSSIKADSWRKLLPNIAFGALCLQSNEVISGLVGLQPDSEGYRYFCVATNFRVLIASSDLCVVSEINVAFGCGGIGPVGSFAACFVTGDHIRYISCAPRGVSIELVGSLPAKLANPCLVAVRQDRVISLPLSKSYRFIKTDGIQFSDVFMHSAVTKPSFLLEPLIANAVCVTQSQEVLDETLLQTLLGKFGRNPVSTIHSDAEGIGPAEGISATTMAMLQRTGHSDAATWLLTNDTHFARGSTPRLSLPTVPLGGKGVLTSQAYTFAHVAANGDQDLVTHIKSPDTFSAVSLPSVTSPVSSLSHEFAAEALASGNVDEAVKVFDLSGRPITEHLMFQLVTNQDKKRLLVNELKESVEVSTAFPDLRETRKHFSRRLATSEQQKLSMRRKRQSLLPVSLLSPSETSNFDIADNPRHVWNTGPKEEKANLLALDTLGEWLSRCTPRILGTDAVKAGRVFADILESNLDDQDSTCSETGSSYSTSWVDGVGEGRSDEDNLCLYFRMSEGDDNASSWRKDGRINDLSRYGNFGQILSDLRTVELQQSTSMVDEGEPGRVRGIFDLVFMRSCVGMDSGLSIAARRGSSLDIGIFSGNRRDESRRKCTIEFWYFIPNSNPADEVILARRTMSPSSTNALRTLWDLVLLPSGIIEFRSNTGSSVKLDDDRDDDSVDEYTTNPTQHGWNHVCLILDSRNLPANECDVTLYLSGRAEASARITVVLNEDDATAHSELVFGIDHCDGFRMTEIRAWACIRSKKDVQSFMHEYLSCAELRRKLRVNISDKRNSKLLSDGSTAESSTRTTVSPAKSTCSSSFSLAPSFATRSGGSGSPFPTTRENALIPINKSIADPRDNLLEDQTSSQASDGVSDTDDEDGLWDGAVPLSELMRPSTASAFIRGPPATRHFGGNRGGLPDSLESERVGVGGVAIAGPERTVIWRDDPEPMLNSYPLGASGAIVSDMITDESSDFVCLFNARERNIVVYKLNPQAVVVELEMTTKLSFWRFLPPEADGNTLCIMLITTAGGFHWRPLDENPQPRLLWKRGPELRGKKIVTYEEGGTNGHDDFARMSRIGLALVTQNGSFLEAWIVSLEEPAEQPRLLSDSVVGACLCCPAAVSSEPFLPVAIMVEIEDTDAFVSVITISEVSPGSFSASGVEATFVVDMSRYKSVDWKPPALSMGTLPEVLCLSLSNIIVVIFRRKGLVVAFEIEEQGLSLIAEESVDHYIADGVMRFSAELGGLELVMLLVDETNSKDGRVVSFSFRAVA